MSVLKLTRGYWFGVEIYKELCGAMLDGKPISTAEDMGLLAQVIFNSKGEHLEIGSAYGGSLMVAIKAMDEVGRKDKVVCIEPFGEDKRDTLHKAVEKEFWRNVEHFGIKDRFELVKEFSQPFPIEERKFGTAFIDGDHSFECVLSDWLNTKDIVSRYIILHDYTKKGVKEVVEGYVVPDPQWWVCAIHGWSAVAQRRTR
jgi:cephalosporin hydroxylase